MSDEPGTIATTLNIRDRQELESICQLLLQNKSMRFYVGLTSASPLGKAEMAEELNLVGEQIDFEESERIVGSMDKSYEKLDNPKNYRCVGTYFLTGLDEAQAFVCEGDSILFLSHCIF